jgi:polar amino acid transport system substrate-binding protein
MLKLPRQKRNGLTAGNQIYTAENARGRDPIRLPAIASCRGWRAMILPLLIIAAVISCTGENQDSPFAQIRSKGILRIGTDATYPPFEYNDDKSGQVVGFDIDLMMAICRKLKLKPEFIVVPFGGIIAGLRANKYDCIISAMTITPERLEAVDFTIPYYEAGQAIAVPLAESAISSLDDLKGKRIGVQLGTTGEIMARSIEGAEVISFNNIGAAFIDMENGHLDAVLNDAPTSRRAIRVRGSAKIVGPLLSAENYGIAVASTNKELLAALNGALEELIDEGLLDSLNGIWVEK